jgi:hypothetical protein
MLVHGDMAAAAVDAGVSRQTLWRWQSDPTFMAALREAEAALMAEFTRRLLALADDASSALKAALGAEQPIATRLRAADVVLGRLLQWRQLVDLEDRVAALEGVIHAD